MNKINHMNYLPDMQIISHDIFNQVMDEMNSYAPEKYTPTHIETALANTRCSLEDFKALLSPAAEPFLEELAKKAKIETRRHFGNSVSLFTPLYISNYCENHCTYCGFNCKNKIRRAKLDAPDIEKEMKSISETGLEEILILTGESRSASDVEYIGEACKISKKYFKNTGLEIYPMNVDEYEYLRNCGADYITVFQETYDSEQYEKFHPAGHKRIFPYRFHAQERALMAGMRGVGFAALLGLSDFRKDAFATGLHANLIQKKYPWAEISFSCPRLRPAVNSTSLSYNKVNERQLLQIMCAYRIFMPFAMLTISTRERGVFRDNVVGLAATKISAGVSTGIGEHTDKKSQGDEQFEIADRRSVRDIYESLKKSGLQPVMNDYVSTNTYNT